MINKKQNKKNKCKNCYIEKKTIPYWALILLYPFILFFSICLGIFDIIIAFIPVLNCARLMEKVGDNGGIEDYFDFEVLTDTEKIKIKCEK